MKTPVPNDASDVISVAAMQQLEAAAFASGRVSSEQAMRDAGAGVVDVIGALKVAERDALILCGAGNNGGDGYVVACGLHDLGWQVRVVSLGAAATPDARTMETQWLARGKVLSLAQLASLPPPGVIVDALFGIGLSRPITGALAQTLDRIDQVWPLASVPRVAVDLPSGLSADTGAVMGTCLAASRSVTFHKPKPAHLSRPDLCGQVEVVDIGL